MLQLEHRRWSRRRRSADSAAAADSAGHRRFDCRYSSRTERATCLKYVMKTVIECMEGSNWDRRTNEPLLPLQLDLDLEIGSCRLARFRIFWIASVSCRTLNGTQLSETVATKLQAGAAWSSQTHSIAGKETNNQYRARRAGSCGISLHDYWLVISASWRTIDYRVRLSLTLA